MLRRIPLSANTILVVGSGSGSLIAAYRAMNPTARLLGVDTDPDSPTNGHMDEIATIDVEAEPLPFEVPGGIDCIIYDGILERVRDPWGLLRRHAEALGPDGMMLIRVPNMEHWSVADRLLCGTWSAAAIGPGFEPPRLWFSLDAMRHALLEVGLVLCDVMRHDASADQDAASRFVDAILPALSALGVDRDDYARRASPTHLIWRVRKQKRRRMVISGNMLTPVGGVSHVRVVHPLQAIGTDPLISVNLTDRVNATPAPDDMARIFILHRPALTGRHGPDMLRGLIRAGYLVVTEFDDHPDFFQMMQLGGELSFRGVHAIQTSTPALAEVLRKYNPEIAVFPNTVRSLPPPRNFADPQAITCFFGALNREEDWRPLLPAINAVASKAGERLKFQVVHDQQFFQALESPHKSFTPTCDYDTYMQLLGTSEISFMPLADTPFNRAKSDLKFIEAGSRRVAALASTVVYGDSVEDGRTGLLFRDATELHSRLLRLVAMPDLACSLADAAREYVLRERMLAYQVAPRIAWYRSLWERRDLLATALRARMNQARQTAA
jgi:hypothetical protein